MHPSVTVVVPTHNRRNLVCRVLEALESQTYQGQLDYVIVADGCTDDTLDVLRTLDLRRNLKVIESPGKGSAAARNLGASVAKGEFLIFVDDDVIPSATLVAQHIECHFKFPDSVVVGACPYGLAKKLSTLAQFARDWWHEVYREMSWPCGEDSYKCLLTGNLSIRRDLFLELGGFDETFRFPGREDYEFGVRLLKAGVKIRFNPEAYGYHYPADSFMARLPSFRSMGRGDVILVRKHHDVQVTTNLANLHQKGSVKSFLKFTSLRFPRIASMLVFCTSRWLAVTQSVIPLGVHGSILSLLVQLQYWLGVREEGFLLPEHDSLAKNSWMLDAATRRIRILQEDISQCVNAITDLDNLHTVLVLVWSGNLPLIWLCLDPRGGRISIPHVDMGRAVAVSLANMWWMLPQFDGAEMKSKANGSFVLTWDHLNTALNHPMRTAAPPTNAKVHLSFLGAEDGHMDLFTASWVKYLLTKDDVAAVAGPVLPKSVDTRADELTWLMSGIGPRLLHGPTLLEATRSPARPILEIDWTAHWMAIRTSLLDDLCPNKNQRNAHVALFRLLTSGYSVLYEPRAVVWRENFTTRASFRRSLAISRRNLGRFCAQVALGRHGPRKWFLGVTARWTVRRVRRLLRWLLGRELYPPTAVLSEMYYFYAGVIAELWEAVISALAHGRERLS